jgi:hypothetical protein
MSSFQRSVIAKNSNSKYGNSFNIRRDGQTAWHEFSRGLLLNKIKGGNYGK